MRGPVSSSSAEVRFVLGARRCDDEGYLYAMDITALAASDASEVLQGDWSGLSGGFVFLVDGVVWNSYDQPWNRGPIRDRRFDPQHLRLPLDTLAFVPLLLRGLIEQADARPTIVCTFHEMTTLELIFVSDADVRMRGVGHDGAEVYRPATLRFAALTGGLAAATEQFLAVARPLLAPRATANARLLDELQACLDALRRL